MRTQFSVQFPLQKYNFVTAVQKMCKNRYQNFSVLSKFVRFLIFSKNILYMIAEVCEMLTASHCIFCEGIFHDVYLFCCLKFVSGTFILKDGN